jgi:hypothetical protein
MRRGAHSGLEAHLGQIVEPKIRAQGPDGERPATTCWRVFERVEVVRCAVEVQREMASAMLMSRRRADRVSDRD